MDYLTNGIGWTTVEKMMMDAPSIDLDDDQDDYMTLTKNNNQDIKDYVNSIM